MSFNLTTEPWIPVVDARGEAGRVSLLDVFQQDQTALSNCGLQPPLRDLHARPHERIALMRLLICVAQRALDGPEDLNRWQNIATTWRSSAAEYLQRPEIAECFNLLGSGPRFLQIHGMGAPGMVSIQRMQFIDEETTTLFDQHSVPGLRMSKPEVAVALVTYQNFCASGTVGGSEPSRKGRRTISGEIKGEPQKGTAGICRDGAAFHTFLVGKDLWESVFLNLLSRDTLRDFQPIVWSPGDRPLWEYRFTKMSETEVAERQLTVSYLGRLVPMSRCVWLQDDLSAIETGRGFEYPLSNLDESSKKKRAVSIREPSSAVRRDEDGKLLLVRATSGGGIPKAAWRELYAVSVLRHGKVRGGPAVLDNLLAANLGCGCVWTGALIGGGKGKAAKVSDSIESVFRLPTSLIEPQFEKDKPSVNNTYRNGVDYAEGTERRLGGAVAAYRHCLRDELEKGKGRDRGNKIKGAAAAHFWTALEQVSAVLLDVACEANNCDGYGDANGYMEGGEVVWPQSPWGERVLAAARAAYEHTCPRNTPSQLRAYAAGLKTLFNEQAKDASKLKSTRTRS